jgi:hypothetical protein
MAKPQLLLSASLSLESRSEEESYAAQRTVAAGTVANP